MVNNGPRYSWDSGSDSPMGSLHHSGKPDLYVGQRRGMRDSQPACFEKTPDQSLKTMVSPCILSVARPRLRVL
jgi:hypothetical protein